MKKTKAICICMSLIIIVLIVGVINHTYNHKNTMDKLYESYANKLDIDHKLENELMEANWTTSDKYFLKGWSMLNLDQNEAKKYFKLAIDNIDSNTTKITKIYSYKFLSVIEEKNNNVALALEYANNAFESINPNEYNKYHRAIWDILIPFLDYNSGRHFALDCLEKVITNEDILTKETQLYIHTRLATVYMSLSKYSSAIETRLKIMTLSEELGNDYSFYKTKMDLGILAKMIGEYNQTISILNSTDVSNVKNAKEKLDLETFKYITLAQTQILLNNPNTALETLKHLTGYENILTDDKVDDLNILKDIVSCEAYIEKNDLNLAKTHLESAKNALANDSVSMYMDKDIYYYLVSAKLYEAMGLYINAENDYKKAISLSTTRENVEYLERSTAYLINLYSKMGNLKSSDEYKTKLLEIYHTKNSFISEDYYNYVFYKANHIKAIKENIIIKIVMAVGFIIFIILIAILYKIFFKNYIYKRLLKKRIRDHILKDEYKVYYQTIINPENNSVMGIEGLLRLKVKDKLIMPNIIIKEIEFANMMAEISIWILSKIICDYKVIKKSFPINDNFYISMNISLNEIEDNATVKKLISLMKNSNIEKNSICLEITENVAGTNLELIKENIKKLRECGFIIAIDDFGVDYSNISILDKFQYDIIKLDRCFINGHDNSHISNAVIKVAESLSSIKNTTLVIEGVETKEQLDFIKNTISERFYIQGYYYSKPVPIENLKMLGIS